MTAAELYGVKEARGGNREPRSVEQEEASGSKERTGLFTSGILARRQGKRLIA